MIRKYFGFRAVRDRWGKEGLVFIWGLLFFCAFLALQSAARQIDGFGEWYAAYLYPCLEGSIGRFFGLFPFSVSEIFLYAALIGFLIYGIRHLRQWRKVLNRTFFAVSALLLVYTLNCGINYYRRPFTQLLDYQADRYTTRELVELMEELTRQVNLTYKLKNGTAADGAAAGGAEEAAGTGTAAISGMNRGAVAAMEKLGAQYPALSGFYPKPKALLFSRLLSVQQLSGIYSPFTIEANYNGEMPSYNIPHTACHELSHLKGFMREEEANFIGFLACIGSDDREFRYSGYLSGWIYAGNALAREDPEKYFRFYNALNEDTTRELIENSEFWDHYDTKAARVSETLNDTYLKANSQTEGIKSYGRVVDLILAWYHQ